MNWRKTKGNGWRRQLCKSSNSWTNGNSKTTASARSSMRSEKAVQDWINTSLALSFSSEEKTGEPEVTKDPPECPSRNNGKELEDHNTDISRHSVPKNCRGNYTLSNENSQQLDLNISHLIIFCLLLTHRRCTRRIHGRKWIKQANKAQRFRA